MVNTSNGREAMALARSTTMAPLSTVLGGRSEMLHPKLTTNGRPMTTAEVHSKLSLPDMTVEEVQNILTAWTENEAILRRRGGESRDWRDPKLYDPYKEERSFVTLVPDRKPYDPYKGFNDVHRDSSNTAGLLRVQTNQEDLDPFSPAAGGGDTHSGRVPCKVDPDYFRHVTPVGRGNDWEGSGMIEPTSEPLLEMHPDMGGCKPMRMRIPLHSLVRALDEAVEGGCPHIVGRCVIGATFPPAPEQLAKTTQVAGYPGGHVGGRVQKGRRTAYPEQQVDGIQLFGGTSKGARRLVELFPYYQNAIYQ